MRKPGRSPTRQYRVSRPFFTSAASLDFLKCSSSPLCRAPQDKKADAYARMALLFTPTGTTLSFGNGFGNCIAWSSEEASACCFGGEHYELFWG